MHPRVVPENGLAKPGLSIYWQGSLVICPHSLVDNCEGKCDRWWWPPYWCTNGMADLPIGTETRWTPSIAAICANVRLAKWLIGFVIRQSWPIAASCAMYANATVQLANRPGQNVHFAAPNPLVSPFTAQNGGPQCVMEIEPHISRPLRMICNSPFCSKPP